MTDNKREEAQELYNREIYNLAFQEYSHKLESMKDHPSFQDLCDICCDNLVWCITSNYDRYPEDISSDMIVQVFMDCVKYLDGEHKFYWAFYYFISKDYGRCMDNIFALLQNFIENDFVFKETNVIDCIAPFKDAFEGFWDNVIGKIKSCKTENGIMEYCAMLKEYYTSYSGENIVECILNLMQKYPDFKSANELLGYQYYKLSLQPGSVKRWHNVIACLEKSEELCYYVRLDYIYWMLAWSYGKVKDYANEEKYYRKCIEIEAPEEYLLNNLGWCLYRQKKYEEAKTVFEECLEKKLGLKCAVNNYVKVLIVTGRNKDAIDFVRNGKFKVSKDLRDRVEKLTPVNTYKKSDIPVTDDENAVENRPVKDIKWEQFSNERLLEDELTARIEAGTKVFGLELKVYKRHGEYGRQYIIPVGRLDLLCEDNEGALYVIELKKDSGYDDVYEQISGYLDWFENSEKFKGKKVYGIICLNAPTQVLIDKVHKDKRMKLYEYQISYTEI